MVSCDSAGGIGEKPLDLIRASAYAVGKFTARVALMEVLAAGGRPFCITGTLSVEPTPAGQQMIKGIRSEMKNASLSSSLPILTSTEKNFPVKQTGMGVTVVGLASINSLRIGRCEDGDMILVVGIPHVGDEVMKAERNGLNADSRDVIALSKSNLIHEIIPAGSKGILHEAKVLAIDSDLRFKHANNAKINLEKSAGPATVLLCTCEKSSLARISQIIHKPVFPIGTLID